MKKTLGILTLASTFLFGANNLLTIVEQNSLTKMGHYNIKSYANPNNAMEISKGVEDAYFHNFSPYAYTEIDGYENDLNVIVMVGEKTIQYGSIYSKGFGEKYNINTLVNLIKKRDLAAALNTLDTFQQDNLIYIRNKVSIINNNDLEILKNYINTEVSEDRRYSYLKKIEVIYSLVDYANSIYSYTRSNLELDPVNNIFFNIKQNLSNPKILTSTRPNYNTKAIYDENGQTYYVQDKENYNGETLAYQSKKEFEMVNDKLVKRCLYPVIFSETDAEGYSSRDFVYYDIKDVISVNLNKPLSIPELYILTHNVCPTVKSSGKGRWKWRNRLELSYPTIPSASGQRDWATSVLKQSRNQGNHANKIKSYYSGLQNNIAGKLRALNDIGIVDGKIMHISYNLTESISNEKVVQGIVKMATTGTIFRDRFKVLSSEGIDYKIKNLPEPEKTSYSELTKDDSGNKYGTLYYFYNTKAQSNSPMYDDFHRYASIVPTPSKNSSFLDSKNGEKIEGMEVLWITKNDGTPIQPYLYNNKNEILILENNLTNEDLIENTTSYLRSEVDIWGSENVYPLNIKTIKTESFAINTKNNALKYFGPIFDKKIYLDKHIKVIEKEVPLDCSKESCTEEQKKMSNPTKIVQEEIVNLYCGAGFVNPDKKKYTYEVLQDIQNRFIEKPFGDVYFHYNKDLEEELIEIHETSQKVPHYYHYVGLVESKEQCIEALNSISLKEIEEVLIEEEALDFNFKLRKNVLSMDEDAQGKYIGNEEFVYTFSSELLNNMTLVYDNIEIIEATFVNNINYEGINEDTYYNYFKDLKSKGQLYNKEDQIDQLLIPQI